MSFSGGSWVFMFLLDRLQVSMDPGRDLTVQQAEAWYWDRMLFPSQIQAEGLL